MQYHCRGLDWLVKRGQRYLHTRVSITPGVWNISSTPHQSSHTPGAVEHFIPWNHKAVIALKGQVQTFYLTLFGNHTGIWLYNCWWIYYSVSFQSHFWMHESNHHTQIRPGHLNYAVSTTKIYNFRISNQILGKTDWKNMPRKGKKTKNI